MDEHLRVAKTNNKKLRVAKKPESRFKKPLLEFQLAGRRLLVAPLARLKKKKDQFINSFNRSVKAVCQHQLSA